MQKDIILFINAIRPATLDALRVYNRQETQKLRPVVLVDAKIKDSITERNSQTQLRDKVEVLVADYDSAASIREALRPYMDRLFAVTSQYENSVYELQKLVPYLPYLPTPTVQSLTWATEKKDMRRMLEAYDPTLVPRYIEVSDASELTIDEIERTIPYPMVVKPSGLEGSLLVSLVKDTGELEKTLRRTFKEMQKAYDKWIKRQEPAILVESFMDGDMYSIDTYVAKDGTCRHTPPVKVVTGRKMGFDDFFAYTQSTPTDLSEAEVKGAEDAAERACHALGLRSVTGHVELMKLGDSWKIVEVGPRVGGYRHELYSLSYGINHLMNDILNRAGKEPIIPREVVGYTTILKFHAKEEGILVSTMGLDEARKLSSYVSHKQAYEVGEEVLFAKNNGDPVFEFLLNNVDEVQLLKDIQTIEQAIHLAVASPSLDPQHLFHHAE